MARTNTTAAAPATLSHEEELQQLMAQILNRAPVQPSGSITRKLAEFTGDRIAGAGDLFAEVTAGFSAAGRNYTVQKELAETRQARRTAERVLEIKRMYQQ